MTLYILDTNIASAFAPKKTATSATQPDIIDWFSRNQAQLYISTITMIEIEAGVLKLGRTAPGRWRRELSIWYDVLLARFSDRILALDIDVARIAAGLSDRSAERGLNPGLPDMAIAATAIAYGMVLLTRNLRHFSPLGIAAIDPFERLPT